MIAYIEMRKGAKDIVHTNPDECDAAKALFNPMTVALSTGLNGAIAGQWDTCPTCHEIDESVRRFIQGS